MNFLASDALRGRGSATHDELLAALYIAAQLQQYGVQPAGPNGGYLEKFELVRTKSSTPPRLDFAVPGAQEPVVWQHGAEMIALHMGRNPVSGGLQKVELGSQTPIQKDAFVLLSAPLGKAPPTRADAERLSQQGAKVVLLPASKRYLDHWSDLAKWTLSGRLALAGGENESTAGASILVLSDEAFAQLEKLPPGLSMKFTAPSDPPQKLTSYSVVGKIPGSGPHSGAILFSAHLDHLGVKPDSDQVYNGADDDASGVAAVLELARIFGSRPKPKRAVLFALFGSEELGEWGSKYFAQHPPVPLNNIVAGLEFEMIGRRDPAVSADNLWLTGWSRSNLGPILAAHGAKLMADPHPEQNFFERSDNYPLAEKGVVAQTISSFGLHPDYHQPSDKIDRIDFSHMNRAIGSLIGPMQWLANSNFRPKWNAGEAP